jgi:hypothetical protein
MNLKILKDGSGVLKFTDTDLVDYSLTFEYLAEKAEVWVMSSGGLRQSLQEIVVVFPNITIKLPSFTIIPGEVYKLFVRRLR